MGQVLTLLVSGLLFVADLAWVLVKWVGGFVIALLLLNWTGRTAWEQAPPAPCPETRDQDPLGIRD